MTISGYPGIDATYAQIVRLAEMQDNERARWLDHNPSRFVTPIEFNFGEVYAWCGRSSDGNMFMTRDGLAQHGFKARAVPLCDLHNVRPLWFD